MGVEAIRALAGYFPQRNAKLSLDGSAANDDTSDLRMRSKAWSVSALCPSPHLRGPSHFIQASCPDSANSHAPWHNTEDGPRPPGMHHFSAASIQPYVKPIRTCSHGIKACSTLTSHRYLSTALIQASSLIHRLLFVTARRFCSSRRPPQHQGWCRVQAPTH